MNVTIRRVVTASGNGKSIMHSVTYVRIVLVVVVNSSDITGRPAIAYPFIVDARNAILMVESTTFVLSAIAARARCRRVSNPSIALCEVTNSQSRYEHRVGRVSPPSSVFVKHRSTSCYVTCYIIACACFFVVFNFPLKCGTH